MKHCRQAGSISELGLADNPARLSSADTERPIFPLESGYDSLLSPEQQYEQGASANLSTHEAFVIHHIYIVTEVSIASGCTPK